MVLASSFIVTGLSSGPMLKIWPTALGFSEKTVKSLNDVENAVQNIQEVLNDSEKAKNIGNKSTSVKSFNFVFKLSS